jgi:hypothetical protein
MRSERKRQSHGVGNSMLKPGGLGSDLKKYHVTRKE